MAGVDEEINLDQLKLLKKIFEEADEDGSGELDIDEFIEKLGPHLGNNLTEQQIRQLFMKIDADAGGTVDWEEFTNYMFLERAQEASGTTSENWRLFPQDFRDKNDPGVAHRGPVDRIMYCEAIDKYITCSRDGSFRLWNGADLKHFRTMTLGSSWITDCIYMPQARKLVFTTVDRAVSYYEANRGSYELSGRVYASGTMGVPQALTLVTNDAGEQLVYGDSKGHVIMLLCGTREWPARDLISTDEHQDYIYIHQEHTDWVSQVAWVPEIGLVSSSVDSTIRIYDFVREKVINNCTHHTKAVYGFVWCSAYSMFASCGLERDVILWQGNTVRRIGELTGHTASVTHISLDTRLNHVFTLSADKVIKVWDLRNHRCLQTITQDDWKRPEEARPHCLVYDSLHRRVITAMNRPYVWVHKMVAQDRTGHMDAVRGVLYNHTFGVVVTADESGTVCVWNITNGQREGRFMKAHGEAKLTAMCFDKNERRLVTAGGDGSVYMWNFNNGSRLRSYTHGEEGQELSMVLFAADEKRESDAVYAAGWGGKVYVWEDDDDDHDTITSYRTYEGHREDVTHMAAFPERALLATGDYEGRITVWGLFNGEKRLSLFHRAERYETSIEKLMWVPVTRPGSTAGSSRSGGTDSARQTQSGGTGPMLLLSCGGDGLMRVWQITTVGKLLCTLPGAQGRLEQVTAICADRAYSHVVVGDSAGHIRVWDLRAGIDTSTPDALRASFKQRCHWRAHRTAVLGVDCVPGERPLIVAGSRDHNVTIWTYDGGMLGTLGDDVWVLDDLRTWRDPDALDVEPIMGETDNLYLQVPKEDADEDEEGGRGRRGKAADPAAELDLTSLQLVNALITEKRSKAREAAITQPMGLHSQLHVHDLQPVPGNVRELLRGGTDTRAGSSAAGARAGKANVRTGGGLLAPKK
uniref:EF-hand domain-containing protein n=1 Tax=Chlamydomonas leiostraca TaxID=1034604 RepID=A0A7S0WPJ8_9CHLO|mmetsp:Transcript_22304/g.56747  ORF Transcript_22304/g.56747 Transcript_22304/m.56747 type:complete len:922 (+) Transcript_22304:196-2961(+)